MNGRLDSCLLHPGTIRGAMQGAVETPAGAAAPTVAPGFATRFARKSAAYVALTKPRVIELLLVTTAPVTWSPPLTAS